MDCTRDREIIHQIRSGPAGRLTNKHAIVTQPALPGDIFHCFAISRGSVTLRLADWGAFLAVCTASGYTNVVQKEALSAPRRLVHYQTHFAVCFLTPTQSFLAAC